MKPVMKKPLTDRTPFQIRWRLARDKAFKERFYDKIEKMIKDTKTHSSKKTLP